MKWVERQISKDLLRNHRQRSSSSSQTMNREADIRGHCQQLFCAHEGIHPPAEDDVGEAERRVKEKLVP